MKRLLGSMALLGAAACGGDHCVARGARVRTPCGDSLIEEVGEGDEVLCVDPESGVTFPARVIAIRRAKRECLRLEYGDGALIATSDHPLYCPDDKAFAPAGDWALGKRSRLLRVSGEGVAPIQVHRTSTYVGVFEVFDLTVDHPLHNFVANGVLVHNKPPVPRLCELPDGGVAREGAPCACPDGSEGWITCYEGDPVTCNVCDELIPDTGDAGEEDAGE